MSVFTLESIYINVLFFRDKIEIYFDLNLGWAGLWLLTAKDTKRTCHTGVNVDHSGS
jgi:hypothetical protein